MSQRSCAVRLRSGADFGCMSQTKRMFDPFFPVALICGPLALALLLSVEAKRTTQRIWPLSVSLLLAIPAAWGLSYWLLMIAVILFGEEMNGAGFQRATIFGITASIIIVVASYCLVTYRRKHRAPTS